MMNRKKIIAIFVLLLAVSLGALLFWPTAPTRSLPSPNGYDALIEAALQLTDPPDLAEATIEQLRDYVVLNRDVLTASKAALEMECMVPTKFGSEDYINVHLPRLMAAKTVARAFAAEGNLAELEMRNEEAATIFLSTIHLGQSVTRNGVAIDMVVGIACEGIGASSIEKLLPKLTAETCIDLARRIDELNDQREPLAYIKRNEYRFMRSQRNWVSMQAYLRELVARILSTTTVLEKSWPRYNDRSNATKLLASRLV